MSKTRITNLVLGLIAIIGGYLVSEQIISQESLIEIQGVVGLALGGGSITLLTVLGLIKLIPQEMAIKIVEKVGVEKVNGVFDKVDNALDEIANLQDLVAELKAQLDLERQAKKEIGAYDGVSQDLKDKL